MKRLFAAFLCLSLCACLSSCASPTEGSASIGEYERGWDDGYDLGYYDGHEDGHDQGYDDGYEEGTKNGSSEDSYDNGYNDGYQDGATFTCLFLGDVDRALKSAYKGSSWGTFIDAYDQYISNIYDDRETRSKLFWSLVSVKSGDGLTTEERDLLISTFGEELFSRNDIELKTK